MFFGNVVMRLKSECFPNQNLRIWLFLAEMVVVVVVVVVGGGGGLNSGRGLKMINSNGS